MNVGWVLGTQPASTATFRVLLADDAYLQLDDLVVVATEVPGVGEVHTYGIVTEAEARYEGASFDTDTRRIAEEGTLPAETVRVAEVAITRVIPEVWVSPNPGSTVARAEGAEREKALYADEMERALPIGLGRDEQPVHLDLDFFDGRKGGHVSISGISGVATKTSFALFFLRMLTGRPEILGEGATNLRVLVFNVKGEDLLWLDHPNARFDDDARAKWATLGVTPEPFPSVGFWAPAKAGAGGAVIPDASGRMEGVDPFRWTPREFIDEGLLRFLFTDAADGRNQLAFVEERVRAQLKRWAADIAGEPGAVVLRRPGPEGHRKPVSDLGDDELVIRDFDGLVAALESLLEPVDESDPDPAWAGRVQQGTISAFVRRLYAAQARVGHLIAAGASRRIDRRKAQVTVVAIQSLHDLAQRFVVGAMLAEVFEEKEQSGGRLPLSVIVLDELNKYAPREGQSPLKEMLIDIAQRGRSLGVLLVGAQQTASRVAQEVMENAAIRVAGRLDAAEAERSEYGWMLPSTRARARLLKPGTMVVSQPSIPVPLVVTFPFPPWATRAEEVLDDTDPFDIR